MIAGIYKITCKINNKVYIGRTQNIPTRWCAHLESPSNRLKEDIDKYGIENFIFEILETPKDGKLKHSEAYYIDKYDSRNNGYNTLPGSYDLTINTNERYERIMKNKYLIKLENDDEVLYFSDYYYLAKYFNISEYDCRIRMMKNKETNIFNDYFFELIINDGSIIHKYINPEHDRSYL